MTTPYDVILLLQKTHFPWPYFYGLIPIGSTSSCCHTWRHMAWSLDKNPCLFFDINMIHILFNNYFH